MDNLSFAELREVNVPRCNEDFKHSLLDWSVLEWAGAMCGEAGEAANVAKKMQRHRDGLGVPQEGYDELRTKLADELADIICYIDLLAARELIDLGEAVRKKFNVVSVRLNSNYRL